MSWFWPFGKKEPANSGKVDPEELTVTISALKKKTVPAELTNEFLSIIPQVEGIRELLQMLHTDESAVELLDQDVAAAKTQNNMGKVKADQSDLDVRTGQMKNIDNKLGQALGMLGTRIGAIQRSGKPGSKQLAKELHGLLDTTIIKVAGEIEYSEARIAAHKQAGNWF